MLGLVAAWHIFASFLWIAPASPLREVVPGDALTNYMLPFFGQSWSVFAPAPTNGDYRFDVRAELAGDDGPETTDWVRATDVELSIRTENLWAPRAGIQSSELASEYMKRFDGLGPSQHDVIAASFSGADALPALKEQLDASLSVVFVEANSNRTVGVNEVNAYMDLDQKATAYATQVARAVWGPGVRKVQFRASRQNIVPFEERHDPGARRPEPMVRNTGWREPFFEAGQNEENFARVFRGQYDRIAQ